MSMLGGRVPPGREVVGERVATFGSYEAAQKAVSSLIAGDVPARDIAIVGQGLRSIERITGRLGYAAAARSGAVSGLMLSLLFAFIFLLGNPDVPITAFVGVLLVGVAVGMLLQLIAYAVVRRRRDFASVMQVVADSYEVCVLPTSLHKARSVLGPATTVAAPPRPEAAVAAAPQYGERVAPGAQAPVDGVAAAPAPAARPAPTPIDDAPPRYGERVLPPAPGGAPRPGPDAPAPEQPPADTPADRPAGTPATADDEPRDRPA